MQNPSLEERYDVLSTFYPHPPSSDSIATPLGALLQSGALCKITSLWVCSALSSPNEPSYRDEHLFVDLRDRVVIVDSETVTLTRMQYRLLALLVEHAGEVVPRATIMMQVWVIFLRRTHARWMCTFGRYGKSLGFT
jgi:Transcriptional regulatory protein, C terminal